VKVQRAVYSCYQQNRKLHPLGIYPINFNLKFGFYLQQTTGLNAKKTFEDFIFLQINGAARTLC
jgi:hypothetical protein